MTTFVIAVAQLFGALAGGIASIAGGGADGGAGSGWLLLAGLFGAATMLAVAVVLVATWVAAVPDARGRTVPRRNVDLPTLVTQSDPAAPGHVRARAPGLGAPAAA